MPTLPTLCISGKLKLSQKYIFNEDYKPKFWHMA